MKGEIEAAADFLVRLVDKANQSEAKPLLQQQLEQFKSTLTELLHDKFQNHWFPEYPTRGQAYRCIRWNQGSKPDAIIQRAAKECGIKYSDLHLPLELTIWVDPKEVSCRFGEHEGSYHTVASFENNTADKPDSLENALKVSVANLNNRNGVRSPKNFIRDSNKSPWLNATAPVFKPTSPPCFNTGPKTWYQPNVNPRVLYTFKPMNRSGRYYMPVRLAFVQTRYLWNNYPVGDLVTA